MNKKDLPSPDTLRKLLRYDPETGKLFWRERGVEWFKDGYRSADGNMNNWNSQFSGKEAFTFTSENGYRQGRILTALIQAHRVIWAMNNDKWPDGEIDHINGIRDDNRIENLRDVSRVENMRNQRRRSDNKSGITGVMWYKRVGKWHAQIRVNGKSIHLGMFSSIEDAAKARKDAEKEYGFHGNHGKRKGRG